MTPEQLRDRVRWPLLIAVLLATLLAMVQEGQMLGLLTGVILGWQSATTAMRRVAGKMHRDVWMTSGRDT